MKWTSVDEKLPNTNGDVLVNWHRKDKRFSLRNLIKVNWFYDGDFHGGKPDVYGDSHWEVTHWMPLPEPPEKE